MGAASRTKFKQVLHVDLRQFECPGGKFYHGAGAQAAGGTPCRDTVAELLYTAGSIEKDKVDGEVHADGVDRATGHNPQAVTGDQLAASKEPFVAGCVAAGDFDGVGEQDRPGAVPQRKGRSGRGSMLAGGSRKNVH